MRISILGAGNGGTAVAADLSMKGHEVTLIKTSNFVHNENFDYLMNNDGNVKIIEDGKTKNAQISHITRDLSRASESEVVIIYTQTTYHEDIIKRIKPHLKTGQVLLINPGYLSTTYVLKHCTDIDLIIVEAQSSFIDCRISNWDRAGRIPQCATRSGSFRQAGGKRGSESLISSDIPSYIWVPLSKQLSQPEPHSTYGRSHYEHRE